MKKILKYTGIFLLLLIVLVVGFTFLPGNAYLRKAAWAGKASIEDANIFANRAVKTGKVQELEKASDYNQYQLSKEQEEIFTKYHTTAFLILEDGKIKFEKYWEGTNQDTRSNSFSVAKSVVSLLIGIAIEEGKIKGVEQKVADFLPQFKEGKNATLSIRDLLTMGAGLDWSEAYANPLSTVAQAYFSEDIKEVMENVLVEEEPGKVNDYQSGATQYLGDIITKATGKKLSDYASEKLWIPLGADSDALWSLDHEGGTEKAFCCFNTNARNFARLGQLVLQKGEWNGQQLVPEEYIKEAISPASYLTSESLGGSVDYYGYQFWIMEHQGQKIPHMRGVKGQYVCMLKTQNAVVVRLGHDRNEERVGTTPKDGLEYMNVAKKILSSK